VVLSQKALDNIAVEYTQITNKGQAPQLESTNYILTKTSLYRQILKTKDETIQESDGTTSTVVYQKKEMMKYCFTDTYKKKKSNFQKMLSQQELLVDDDYNNFGWKIENVFKKIGNYHT
jgi:GLPGLI family protein